ncbi:UDP-N-acetylglucosamine 2-epimerase [Sphingomonas sp. C3-2]|uniref:UDP-N-acetylglucosamine 2-epimerase n=1 Tax=Sphingomonas sp. C3-2 TaxID=3062169 RepID=UPI00294AD55F|nr:UDP-N-acetylglucosamine 2-epimerase [Sphingomonas sp. C3-2]WOK35108.1 UDP-N-acetylglucosamine 2-epimerase [Sphingomonas sp. C3-2]
MMRDIRYISGTRADYGLMRETLRAINHHPNLRLSLLVTGMHLDPAYGATVHEIEADGFHISGTIASAEDQASGSAMARGIARMITGFTDALEKNRPDLVVLLGDRGEMLAGAIAAIHLDLPIAHIHGGERSGTVDEPVRHAISKLSHYHFTATAEAAQRLRHMGELTERIFQVGAPGLVGLTASASHNRVTLAAEVGFDPTRPIALFVYHPVLQEATTAGDIAASILDLLRRQGFQIIALKPNSDGGSDHIRTILETCSGLPDIRVVTHLPRDSFISWMAVADVMIGNSSAGIIEAASFGTPVINVGMRQNFRQRNANVIDVEANALNLDAALQDVVRKGRFPIANIYGDGMSNTRIADLLASVPINGVTWKFNAY